VFQQAKEKAADDVPVVIFFDEMDALFRSRRSGISSDMEATIVPEFLTEVDGVEGLRNVVVIGASNRPDLIDPAILRPGRLDVKIRIDRPDRAAAGDIFHRYLTADLPIAAAETRQQRGIQAAIDAMIASALDAMYSRGDANRFLEVTYASGDKHVLYFQDVISGALIESVVRRAKKFAVKRSIGGAGKGLTTDDLLAAVRGEFRENEDLPNTTNPDDWAKIAGKKGERVVHVKSLVVTPPHRIGASRRWSIPASISEEIAMGTVGEQLVHVLRQAGVARVYGAVGDSLNPFVDAIRRAEGIEWIHVRNEEAGAFAAAAEGARDGPARRLRGQLRPRQHASDPRDWMTPTAVVCRCSRSRRTSRPNRSVPLSSRRRIPSGCSSSAVTTASS
jgi:hypothetical protein